MNVYHVLSLRYTIHRPLMKQVAPKEQAGAKGARAGWRLTEIPQVAFIVTERTPGKAVLEAIAAARRREKPYVLVFYVFGGPEQSPEISKICSKPGDDEINVKTRGFV